MSIPTYRYTVTFEGGAIVQERLEHLLRINFGAEDINFTTEIVTRLPKHPKHLKLTPEVWWRRLFGQIGGLAKVGSGSDHAASLRSGLALSGASPG